MLNVLRDSFKSQPWLKLVLAAVGVGLVAYLGNYFLSGGGAASGDWALKVGDAEITQQQFGRALGDQLNRVSDPALKDQIRPFAINQVRAYYIQRQVMLKDAERLGLAISDREVRDRIRTDPYLQTASGEFIGANEYKKRLSANRYPGGATGYERAIRDEIMLQAWTNLVTAPVTVSNEEVLDLYKKTNDRTSVNYVVVSAADHKDDAEIDETIQRRWHEEHADDYARPEGRNIRYVVVTRDSQKANLEIDEEEIRQAYEQQKAGAYKRAEQRKASHILFRVEPDESADGKAIVRAQAEDVLKRLEGGEDFATLATDMSQDPGSAAQGGDLGFFSRKDMVQPFSDAAFSGTVGELVPNVVETIYGFHIIKVTDAREAGYIPFEEVEPGLRRAVEYTKLLELATEEAERMRQGLATSEQFGEMAERLDLTVESAVFFPDQRMVELGASPEFMQAVGALDAGAVSEPLRVNAGLALVAVDEIIPAGLAPLEDVRDDVLRAVRDDLARTVAIELARSAWGGGDSLDAAARTLGQEVKEYADLRPGQSLPGLGAPAPELATALFGDGVATGDSGMLELPSGALLYEVTARTGFDPAQFELEKSRLRTDLLSQRKNDYVMSVLGPMIDEESILENQAYMRRISGG